MELPKLMIDDSEKDGHAETMMDYVFSWCFRMALDVYSTQKPILWSQCKDILCRVLGETSDVEILNVKVWKQEENIDLWVKVELRKNGKIEHHAILIENKYYGELTEVKDTDGEKRNQLIVYKKKFDKYYSEQSIAWSKHYVLITCRKREDNKFNEYYSQAEEKFGYRIITIYEMRGDCTQETESDIYNEFWLRWLYVSKK
jgi:hypothetical protein